MEEIKVKTWDELAAKVVELRTALGENSSLVFRGQSNSCWRLNTTLERTQGRTLFKEYYSVISRIRPQIESFTSNRWDIPEYPEIEQLCTRYEDFDRALWSGRCPAYDYMVHLRHHGFPSPLLDWTRSLYVAAYFAFSTAKEVDSVSIYALSRQPNRISGNKLATVYRWDRMSGRTDATSCSRVSTRCACFTKTNGGSTTTTRYLTKDFTSKGSARNLRSPSVNGYASSAFSMSTT